MDKLLPYWQFFCDNEFAENDKLLFFADGCFAITTGDGVVSLYSNKAQLIAKYCNAFALENGCICERYGENLIVHYKDTQYSLPCCSTTKVRVFNNAVVLTPYDSKEDYLYFIAPEYNDLRKIVLKDGVSVSHTSVDGKVVLCILNKISVLPQSVLTDKNEKVFSFKEAFHRIDFLRDGSYIVHFSGEKGGSTLFNDKDEPVLCSEKDHGILPLGDCVNYETALIANTSGVFIAEYQQEISVYRNWFIRQYSIKKSGLANKYFWSGGQIMLFHSDDIGPIFCYRHAGHFYFVPLNLNKLGDFEDKDSAFQRYLYRIKELI